MENNNNKKKTFLIHKKIMHFCKETFSQHFFLLANNCFSVLCEICQKNGGSEKGKGVQKKKKKKKQTK